MAFREVDVVEVREVLRGWLDGVGLRTVAERAGVDRKTARRYVEAAQAAGLSRDAGRGGVSDELIGAVIAAVRPARPNGHGAAWDDADRPQGARSPGGWQRRRSVDREDRGAADPVGQTVPYRTLHRFAAEECGFRARGTTVPGPRRRAGCGMPDRFRPDGFHHRPGHRAAAEGARADLHRGAVPAHVRAPVVLADPDRGDRRV